MNTLLGLSIAVGCVVAAYFLREKITLNEKVKDILYAVLAIAATFGFLFAYIIIS